MFSLKHIFITGIPASGKSTLAREMAIETGMPHVELDEYFPKLKLGEYDRLTPEEIIQSLKEPSIIEGVQILELPLSQLRQHLIVIIDAPDEVIECRFLESKSWDFLPKRKQLQKIREVIGHKRLMLNKFLSSIKGKELFRNETQSLQ